MSTHRTMVTAMVTEMRARGNFQVEKTRKMLKKDEFL